MVQKGFVRRFSRNLLVKRDLGLAASMLFGTAFFIDKNSLQIICTIQKEFLPLAYQTAKANH